MSDVSAYDAENNGISVPCPIAGYVFFAVFCSFAYNEEAQNAQEEKEYSDKPATGVSIRLVA